MAHIQWTSDLNTNIDIIDDQHKKIVYFINAFKDATAGGDNSNLGGILKEMADYTISHLDFEESLLEKVGYASIKPHQRGHQLFRDRITNYLKRYEQGDYNNVAHDMQRIFDNWLFTHIRSEDSHYADAVGDDMNQLIQRDRHWVTNSMNKYFRV